MCRAVAYPLLFRETPLWLLTMRSAGTTQFRTYTRHFKVDIAMLILNIKNCAYYHYASFGHL